jgi:signal transduction histidine kinase/DNA-binding response OmpR family regulator
MSTRAPLTSDPRAERASAPRWRTRISTFARLAIDVWLPPERAHDPSFAPRARTGVALLLGTLVITLLNIVMQSFRFGDLGDELRHLNATMGCGAVAVMLFGLVMLRVFGALRLSAHLLITYLLAYYVVFTLYTGGALSPVAYCMLAFPLGALVVLGRGAALAWLGIVVLTLGVVYLLHTSGHVFELPSTRAHRDTFWMTCTMGLTAISFATVWAFDRSRTRALAILEEANRELTLARRSADEASASKSAFLQTMSHEIRTPLMAVLGYADIALEEAPEGAFSPEDQLAISTIAQSGHNLLRIVDDLLDIASIESGRIEIRPEHTDVDALLATLTELLGHQAAMNDARLSAQRETGAPAVLHADRLRLQQVLVNLVGNAIKFSAGGSVRLSAQPLPHSEAWIRFEVSDSGIGMTPEQVTRLFRRFSQAEAGTARRFGGTGLGLSISALLVESMGGAITCESRPGQGSTFRVDLPLVSTRPAAGAEPQAVRSPERLDCRVLVVDDTHDNRRLIQHFLERGGADVTIAASGAEALERFEQSRQAGTPHDVIVMDIQMPGMDGFAARRALRERGCDAPIVALTAHAMVSERARCLADGFDDYASKPIDRAALLELVARNAARGRAPSQADVTRQEQPAATSRSGFARVTEALVDRFTPPHAPDTALARRRTRTLLAVSVALAIVLSVELWPLGRVWPVEISRWMLPLVALSALVLLLLPFVYHRTASIVLPVHALATFVSILNVALAYLSGGPGSPVCAWLAIIPISVYAMTGPGPATFWLGVAFAEQLGFWLAANLGVTMADYVTPDQAAFSATTSNINAGILIALVAMAHERARSEAVETLASANRWLDEARAQAERASQTKALFLANVSHELRTPLTAILGFADVLIERARRGTAALDALDRIRRSGQQLLRRINDLLDFAKVDAGSLSIELIPVELAPLLERTLEPHRAEARTKGLRFELALDATLPARIATDPLRLAQVVGNLSENAVKFTLAGHVTVSAGTQRDGDQTWLRIAVEDSGPGIPAEHLPSLFSAFHQVDASSQRERGGSGLGLALCQRLVERMGGSIRAESTLGAGSRFTFELPLREVQDAPREDAARTRRPAPAVVRGLRLLLAEDGVPNQRLITRVLGDAGAQVDLVDNGQHAVHSALERLRQNRPYDLILMDVEMPKLDGLAATRALRDAGYSGPILALTAHSLREDRERCLAAGCNDVASKPIEWASLYLLIASLCADRADKPS